MYWIKKSGLEAIEGLNKIEWVQGDALLKADEGDQSLFYSVYFAYFNQYKMKPYKEDFQVLSAEDKVSQI